MSDLKPSSRRKAKPQITASLSPKPARQPKPVDKATVLEIFRRFEAANPHPEGELEYVNSYTLLVAVLLSAQSTDVGVNKATRALFPIADTPEKMLALGEEGVRERVKTLNYFNTKAKNVIAMSKRLVEEFGGEVPRSMEALTTLPGVGRKTASVVMNIAFRIPHIAVDTHIFRVANRIPFVNTKTPLETQGPLEKLVPDEFKLHAHHWLILHGRYICKARVPECARCLINDLCRYPAKTL
ncbi:endonuclease III [Microvirga alba]|uniref:Endonuclease III n=1 Tax=Microvirga alba TaxID=2791025 RepID=A0A931BSC5_9HYPH|nr:endonuclease III [Microvirga alba]MBF9233763.1 endonuclease III [Microvirga alba]